MSATILQQILAHKRDEVQRRKGLRPLSELERLCSQVEPPRGFLRALQSAPTRPGLIAEIKAASPSKGSLREAPEVAALASAYAAGGAVAISVVTDEEFFGGRDQWIAEARQATPLPVLRKDFIIDNYQVTESRALGADAVLLIMAGLQQEQAAWLLEEIWAREMDALVEIHNEAEAERAVALGAPLIGINNRDLRDFTVNLETTERLRAMIPREVTVVSESGILSAADVERVGRAGADAVLVGEALVASDDPEGAIARLFPGESAK